MRSDGRGELIEVDAEFFEEHLPRIRDLAELKVALHVIRAASGGRTAIPLADLFEPAVVRSIAGAESAEPGVERVRKSIERALANNLLLRLTVHDGGVEKVYLLIANRFNRRLLERLRAGDEGAEAELELPAGVEGSVYRPNIFASYERHIGPLTPLVADQLREAERAYPREWLEQALVEAAHYDRRSWKYVEAVLKSWEEAGAPGGGARRYS